MTVISKDVPLCLINRDEESVSLEPWSLGVEVPNLTLLSGKQSSRVPGRIKTQCPRGIGEPESFACHLIFL